MSVPMKRAGTEVNKLTRERLHTDVVVSNGAVREHRANLVYNCRAALRVMSKAEFLYQGRAP